MADDHMFFADYQGDINLGFHGIVSESFSVVAPGFNRAEVFGTKKVFEGLRISNTDLIGLFAAGNSEGIILPNIVSDHEKKLLEKNDINYMVIDSKHTAIGNLVLVNDKGCLISEVLEPFREEISDFFGVPVETGVLAGTGMVGSAGFVTEKGLLVHREAEREELEIAEKVLGVKGDIGTVNFGSPYVGTGIIGNSKAVMVGNNTTGPETARIDKALGFLK